MNSPSPPNHGRSLTPWWRSRPFLAILLAAGLLRLAGILSLASDPRVAIPILDGKYYMELAGRLAAGQGWPRGPIFMTPFYPWVLGLIFRLAPPVPLTGQVFQALLGLATLALLTAATRRDLGVGPAWALAGLYTLCGPILGIESQILTESLLLFLTSAALYLWPGAKERSWRLLLFGLVAGLLTTGRGVFLLLPLAALAHLWIRERSVKPGQKTDRREKPGKRWIREACMVTLGLALALLPLAVRQIRSTGTLQLLTLNGGMNLYIGNNPYARGIFNFPPEIDFERGADFTAAHSASLLAGKELNLVESNRFWTQRALDFLRGHPGRALWLFSRKALLFLSPREVPQIEDFQILRGRHLPLRLALVDFGWLLPLAALGLWSFLRARPVPAEKGAARRQPVHPAPWLLLIAVGWISTILFFFTGRYRIPFLAGFLGPAALGAYALFGIVKSRRPRLELIAVPVTIVVQLCLPGYPVEKARAYDHYQAGLRLDEAGKPEPALEEYRQAIRLSPEDGRAWHGAGAALVNLHRLPEAADAYRQALVRIPNSAVTHYNLGIVFGTTGRDSLALGELRAASRLDPFDPRMHCDLGVALARTGRYAEAAREFREALRLDPMNGPALQMLQKIEAAQ